MDGAAALSHFEVANDSTIIQVTEGALRNISANNHAVVVEMINLKWFRDDSSVYF